MTVLPRPLGNIGAWLRWQLAKLWSGVSILELLAASAAAFWLGLALYVNAPLRSELDILEGGGQKPAFLPQRGRGALEANGWPMDSVQSFFPRYDDREGQLMLLHTLLDKHGLGHARISYQAEFVHGLPLQRVTLHLDIHGEYRMQRAFIREMLTSLPNLALEEVALEKAEAQGEGMTSLLGLSLYYQRPPGAEAAAP